MLSRLLAGAEIPFGSFSNAVCAAMMRVNPVSFSIQFVCQTIENVEAGMRL